MPNPILQMLKPTNNNNILSVISMLKNGNPETIMNNLMRTNPQFSKFVNENKGKSVTQIAQENGVDLNALKSLMK